MKKHRQLSRRTFLRGTAAGTAVALALPPLEAMMNDKGAFADAPGIGPYFGVFFWANGLPWHAAHGAEQGSAGYPDLWTPSATGAGFDYTPLMTPLERHQVSVATGLEPKTAIPGSPAGQGDGHMRGFMVAMTGNRPRSEGFDHGSHTLTSLGPSLDQYVANHPAFYGASTPRYRSIEVGVSEARFHEYGHWNAISYNGPDSTNAPIMRPTQLFDALFDIPVETGGVEPRTFALDAVMEDAADLRRTLGARDQERLDAHLDNLSEIRRRLEPDDLTCEVPARPTNSGSLHAKTQKMAQLLATAVSCGVTRVFSFMLTSPATTHVFSNLGVSDGMHKSCHDGDWTDVRNITTHQMEAYALFLDAFAGIELPTGSTLLDEGLIYGTSEYGEGWKHGVRELPVVFAGRACGRLAPNVHVRNPRGNVADAQLTALQSIGLPETSWGANGGETTSVLSEVLT
jgi:hypothetical protein